MSRLLLLSSPPSPSSSCCHVAMVAATPSAARHASGLLSQATPLGCFCSPSSRVAAAAGWRKAAVRSTRHHVPQGQPRASYSGGYPSGSSASGGDGNSNSNKIDFSDSPRDAFLKSLRSISIRKGLERAWQILSEQPSEFKHLEFPSLWKTTQTMLLTLVAMAVCVWCLQAVDSFLALMAARLFKRA